MGLAVGWSCVVLAYGKKGLRKSLPHSLGETGDVMNDVVTDHQSSKKQEMLGCGFLSLCIMP
jgi:hypothetical protein